MKQEIPVHEEIFLDEEDMRRFIRERIHAMGRTVDDETIQLVLDMEFQYMVEKGIIVPVNFDLEEVE